MPRLRKEREDREALKSKRSRNAQVNTGNDMKCSVNYLCISLVLQNLAVFASLEPSYTVRISHSFILNEEVIKSGLCEDNVRDAIVAEIYCLVSCAFNIIRLIP